MRAKLAEKREKIKVEATEAAKKAEESQKNQMRLLYGALMLYCKMDSMLVDCHTTKAGIINFLRGTEKRGNDFYHTCKICKIMHLERYAKTPDEQIQSLQPERTV